MALVLQTLTHTNPFMLHKTVTITTIRTSRMNMTKRTMRTDRYRTRINTIIKKISMKMASLKEVEKSMNDTSKRNKMMIAAINKMTITMK